MIAASITVRCVGGIWADLRIVNEGTSPVRVHNPGDDEPVEGWGLSREAYQVALLRSLHFLQMTLRTAEGVIVEPADVATLADPIVGPPIELEPGGRIHIAIPLHELYDLPPRSYAIRVTYGDPGTRLSATTGFHCR